MDPLRNQFALFSRTYDYFLSALYNGTSGNNGKNAIPDDVIVYSAGALDRANDVHNLFTLETSGEQGRFLSTLYSLYEAAQHANSAREQASYIQLLADRAFVILAAFPEALERPGRTVGEKYYTNMGRTSYQHLADIDFGKAGGVFTQMAHHFNGITEMARDAILNAPFEVDTFSPRTNSDEASLLIIPSDMSLQ